MTDREELELASRIRLELQKGIQSLDDETLGQLKKSRLEALGHQRKTRLQLNLAFISHGISMAAYPLRLAAMAMALSLGVVGTYYWQQFDQATENEAIDSEILADELPPEIYVDKGFHTWLERSSQSSLE